MNLQQLQNKHKKVFLMMGQLMLIILLLTLHKL
jgi:hypothetical protein